MCAGDHNHLDYGRHYHSQNATAQCLSEKLQFGAVPQVMQFQKADIYERYVIGQNISQGDYGPIKVIKLKSTDQKYRCNIMNKDQLEKFSVFIKVMKDQFCLLGQL